MATNTVGLKVRWWKLKSLSISFQNVEERFVERDYHQPWDWRDGVAQCFWMGLG